MGFVEVFAGQVPQDRDAVIAVMRRFTQDCMGRAVRALGLSVEQAQAVVVRGNLAGPGR